MVASRSSLGTSNVRAVVPATELTTSARAGSVPMRPACTMISAANTTALAQRAPGESRVRVLMVWWLIWFMVAPPSAPGLGRGVGVHVSVPDHVQPLAGLVPEH